MLTILGESTKMKTLIISVLGQLSECFYKSMNSLGSKDDHFY